MFSDTCRYIHQRRRIEYDIFLSPLFSVRVKQVDFASSNKPTLILLCYFPRASTASGINMSLRAQSERQEDPRLYGS